MAIIELQNFSYTYPGSSTPAIRNISLRIGAGELVALIGGNNSGKSTLCLAIAGLIPQHFHGNMQGSVRIKDIDTRLAQPGELAGVVGLLLQNPVNQLSGLYDTVYQEVAFGLENLGTPRQEMPKRIETALEKVGLIELRQRSPYTLSGGQQQRLALASVLAQEPPILALDEPTAMLDPQGSQEVFSIVQQLAQSGATVIIAEHHLEWLGRYANRVLLLHAGEIALDGKPDDVLASPRLLDAGAGWLRYTRAAQLGKTRGLWPADRPLPVSLEQAALGFSANSRRSNAHPDG